MSEQDKLRELTILIAIGKLFSEQSTYLTKELKQKPKVTFNEAVKRVDLFVYEVEKMLPEDSKELITNIVDEFHSVFNQIRS